MSKALFIAGSLPATLIVVRLRVDIVLWLDMAPEKGERAPQYQGEEPVDSGGDALTVPAVTPSQQAFQVASAMKDAENKYLLLLEFIEEQMF
jgi:hypothetical protein